MKKEYLYAIISVLLWSTTATVTKLLLGDLDSMQILLLGSLFAFVFLFIINCIKGNLKEIRSYKPKDFIKIIIIGLFNLSLLEINYIF